MRQSTYTNPHNFEEAKQYLAEGHHIDYEVKIGSHRGALMARDEWLEDVKNGSFIDYDGYGSMLTKNGEFVGGNIRPSSALSTLLAEPRQVMYILWYNR